VPEQYQTLYTDIASSETDLKNSLAQYSGSGTGLTYAAELLAANSNRGSALLEPNAMAGINLLLDDFQKMGITGVTFPIDYPTLAPNTKNSAQYLAFYEKVMRAIQAHGMQAMIETDPSDQDNYQGVTLQSWEQDQLQTAQSILNNLKPNYLTLGTEPDTVAKLTGLTQIESPTAWANSIQYVTQNIKNQGDTKIIAGTDAWIKDATDYAQAVAKVPGLNGFSVHMYPVSPTANANLITIGKIANQAGLPISISETWLYKTDPENSADAGASNDSIFYLDAFSFMAPLDQAFLSDMVTYAKDFNGVWVSPFWTQYFFAYLNYDSTTAANSYAENTALLQTTVNPNIENDQLTSTGQAYAQLAGGQ
jgi:hypothetical protein